MQLEVQNENEIYEIFQVHLHRHLKEKINASVYVTIKDDVLFVRVAKLGIYWETRYPNLFERIVQSSDSEKLATEIAKYFRREVIKTFFY